MAGLPDGRNTLSPSPSLCVPRQYRVLLVRHGLYSVLSSAGMAQGFARPARLIPLSDALRVAIGKVKGGREGGEMIKW